MFSPYLDEESLKLIRAHVVIDDPDVEDLMYWNAGPKGKFTIKSAIKILRKVETDTTFGV